MTLRFFIIVLLSALVLAAEAAALELRTVSRSGASTTSRLAKFDCRFQDNYLAQQDLLFACDGPNGVAKARYDFYLPRGLYGIPTMHVYGTKFCCKGSRIKKALVHVRGRHYRIVVKASRPVSYDVRSVSLSYYVTK
jgi:hypothetical protein